MLADSMRLLIVSCLRATAVLGLVWVLTSVMRRASASTRHFLWTCAIAAAALAPLVAGAMPQWQLVSPPALAALSSVIAPASSDAVTIVPGTDDATVTAADRPIGRDAATRRSMVSAESVEPAYARGAIVVWAGGSAAILLYVAFGAIGAWWLRRSLERLDPPWAGNARALADAFEIRGPIAFAESATVTMPMVCGLWRPLIVLPRSAAHWPDERLRVVLLHELAHVKRRDCLTQALAQIVCAAYWFNPLVWVAARRLRDERERACDDFVLAAGTRGSDYAAHLLEIASAMRASRLSALAASGLAMAHRSQLEGRLMSILDPAIRRSPAFYARAAAGTAVLVITIPVGAVRLQTSAVPAARVPETAAVPVVPRLTSSPDALSPARPAGERAALGAAQIEPRRRVSDRALGALDRALLEAAEDGDVDGITALLAAGANVNAAVEGDGSPLIAAARRGRIAVVGLLLDRGADPNMIVPGDGSPIIMAAGEGHMDVVDLLLKRGALVNQVAPDDENALIQASAGGHLNVVKLLVARGADANARVWADRSDRRQGGEWRTPLNMARRSGHDAVVAYLLSVGARE